MATPFSRTLRSLEREPSARPALTLALVGLLLAAWLVWFLSSRLPVYALSDGAHLEVEQAAHPVVAAVGGRVHSIRAVLGRSVVAGEVLFELDRALEEGRVAEEATRSRALDKEIKGLGVVLATERRGLVAAQEASRAAASEARSRHQAVLAEAEIAAAEAERGARMFAEGLTAEADLQRLQATAVRQRAEAEAQTQALARLASEARRDEEDRQAQLDQLARQLAELEGRSRASAATRQRFSEELLRRSITAPVAGRIGEVSPLRPGSVVAPGDHLATVIPSSRLKVVASFEPSVALARIRPGQPAELRLDGFPWTEHGGLPATVTRVSTAARDGRVWVECRLEAAARSRPIPLAHGLPGRLTVEVDRASPAELVLRSVGRIAGQMPASRGQDGE